MERFIARANIDHYLGLLSDGGCAREKRAMVTKLLVQEEVSSGIVGRLMSAPARTRRTGAEPDALRLAGRP